MTFTTSLVVSRCLRPRIVTAPPLRESGLATRDTMRFGSVARRVLSGENSLARWQLFQEICGARGSLLVVQSPLPSHAHAQGEGPFQWASALRPGGSLHPTFCHSFRAECGPPAVPNRRQLEQKWALPGGGALS